MVSDVLPCYLVCDLSLSMTDHIEQVNAGIREFRGAIHADPLVAARTWACVIGFAATPALLQPLCPAVELNELSMTGPGDGSDFGPAFRLLRETIARDVHALEVQGHEVLRPVVFFASDGRPTDPTTWPEALAALDDPAWPSHPTVIAFGLGAADPDTLNRIGTSGAFLGQDGIRLGTALAASVTGPARRAGAGRGPSTMSPLQVHRPVAPSTGEHRGDQPG